MSSLAVRRRYIVGACGLGVLLFYMFYGPASDSTSSRGRAKDIVPSLQKSPPDSAEQGPVEKPARHDYMKRGKEFHALSKDAREKIVLPLLEDDLSLSEAGIEFMGLTPEQTSVLKSKVGDLVSSYRNFEAEHAEVKPGANDPQKQFVFVPASGDVVRRAFDDLNKTIDAQFSPEQAAFFHRNADVTLNLQTGYAGRFSKLIIVSPNSSPAKPYNIREMVLQKPPEGDFSATDPDALYASGAVANQRSELFKNIPARYQGFVVQSK